MKKIIIITQWVRKFKKVQAKKLVKSNKSKKFFRENAFVAVLKIFPVQKLILAIFEIAKNGIWSKNLFVKLIYLISRAFWPGLFFNFLAHCASH